MEYGIRKLTVTLDPKAIKILEEKKKKNKRRCCYRDYDNLDFRICNSECFSKY